MSQSNVLVRERVTYLAEESTFATQPSSTFPNTPTGTVMLGTDLGVDGFVEDMMENLDERSRRDDVLARVHGLRSGKVGPLRMELKTVPSASQLTSGTSAAALTPRILLRHHFGTETAGQGSTTSGTTIAGATSVTVQDGSRFTKGTWVGIVTSGGLERAKIVNIATNTLTLQHGLVGTTANNAIVKNLYNYCPAESHAGSLTIQRAFVGDSAAQFVALGCYGGVKFDFPEFGKMASMVFEGECVDFAAATASSLATTAITDEMGSKFKFAPTLYLAAVGALSFSSSNVAFEKIAITHDNAWEKVRDGGATSGAGNVTTVTSVVDCAGRPTAVRAAVTLRFDSAYKTAFDADTSYQLVLAQRVGSGATATYWIWELPVCAIIGQPKMTTVGSRLYVDLDLEGRIDTSVTSPGTTDTGNAVYRVAFG